MNNKFNLTREKNVFIAKRNIVDYIWKSANLEGIAITYPQTQTLYDGGIINGLNVDQVIAINNLKRAWNFILENDDISYNYVSLFEIHRLVTSGLVYNPGIIRTTPVSIGGTKWKPNLPIESKIKEEIELLLNQENKSITEKALELMLYLMRTQMFIDGNKRVAMLFANKIMIDNGAGIISIKNEDHSEFYNKLICFYETNNQKEIKEWLYNNCIDGIDL